MCDWNRILLAQHQQYCSKWKTKQTGSISRIGRRKMILMFWLFQIYFKEINAFCFRYRYGIVIMYTTYWTQIVHLLYLAVNFRIVWEEKRKIKPLTHFEIKWNCISEIFRLWCAWSLNCYIKCVHIFLFCLAGNEIYIEKSNYSINDARRWRQFIYIAVENVNLWG